MKKITNYHFHNFKEAVNNCCGRASGDDIFLSDMSTASYSNAEKNSFYSEKFLKPFINMETIKLDDISKYRKQMLGLPEKSCFNEFPAVDAVCIDRNNEWFFIEFKNAKVENQISSIKQKMLNSLWFCFYMLSKSGKDDEVLNSDAIKFSREHITYIVVIKRDKNIDDAKEIEEKECVNKHYTHRKLIEVIGYYFKDVYMLTEYEFRDFILNFKS